MYSQAARTRPRWFTPLLGVEIGVLGRDDGSLYEVWVRFASSGTGSRQAGVLVPHIRRGSCRCGSYRMAGPWSWLTLSAGFVRSFVCTPCIC